MLLDGPLPRAPGQELFGVPPGAGVALARAQHAAELGTYLVDQLRTLARTHSAITEVRGLGLMVAVELSTETAPQVVDAARERGLLLNAVQPNTLRLVPPLVITRQDVDEAVRILAESLASVTQPVTTAVVGHGS